MPNQVLNCASPSRTNKYLTFNTKEAKRRRGAEWNPPKNDSPTYPASFLDEKFTGRRQVYASGANLRNHPQTME
jgi:hypothetical protein